MKRIKGIDLIVSTRPDIIKMSPLILEMNKRKLDFKIHYTGQHTDYNMFKIFAEYFKIDGIINDNITTKPYHSICAVYGDTDSAFQQAYKYKRDGRQVLHIEAGLRCFDQYMYEEINRCLIDRISNFYFIPTLLARDNLIREGINPKFIYHTGNLISDCIADIYNKIEPSKTQDIDILITIHRRENIYNPMFDVLLNKIIGLQKQYKTIFPLHPHTASKIQNKYLKHLDIIEPLGYHDFINAILNSELVITDSGGVLEECCILKKKCIVIRNCTERPEAIGLNACLEPDYLNLDDIVKFMFQKNIPVYTNPYISPYNNKNVSETMVDYLCNDILFEENIEEKQYIPTDDIAHSYAKQQGVDICYICQKPIQINMMKCVYCKRTICEDHAFLIGMNKGWLRNIENICTRCYREKYLKKQVMK